MNQKFKTSSCYRHLLWWIQHRGTSGMSILFHHPCMQFIWRWIQDKGWCTPHTPPSYPACRQSRRACKHLTTKIPIDANSFNFQTWSGAWFKTSVGIVKHFAHEVCAHRLCLPLSISLDPPLTWFCKFLLSSCTPIVACSNVGWSPCCVATVFGWFFVVP